MSMRIWRFRLFSFPEDKNHPKIRKPHSQCCTFAVKEKKNSLAMLKKFADLHY
jgi:hypothetical protein